MMKKAKGILFKGAMVRAILEDRKTQIRRIMRPQPVFGRVGSGNGWRRDPARSDHSIWGENENPNEGDFGPWRRSMAPFGQKGDLLYVKETFLNNALDGYPPVYFYRADSEDKPWDRKWKPSIFMPFVASRISLEITEVRVQRLQEISEEDAIAEGIEKHGSGGKWPWRNYRGNDSWIDSPTYSYQTLWESINRPESWSKNEWVWCYDFRRITPQVREQI